MSEKTKKQSPKRTAAQRIDDLEAASQSLFNVSDNLVQDVMRMKEALKLLDSKVSSLVKALDQGEPVNDEVLSRLMTERNVEELKQKVQNMVNQGFLAAEDAVSENSFVVGSENDDQGNVVNPRLQFALKALSVDLQAKLLGAKIGDTLNIAPGKLTFQVLESYKIQEPKMAAPAAAQEPAAEQSPAAEAESQASTSDTQPVAASN